MAIKFVNLLSKYLPAHYKIAPKDVELILAESLENAIITRKSYLINSLTPFSTEIFYDFSSNVETFKPTGVIKINNEYIKYDFNDLVEHKLMNLTRGYFSTEPTAHCNEILWTAILAEDLDSFSTTIKFTSISNIEKIPQQGKFAVSSDTGDIEIISYENYSQWLSGYQFENVTRGDSGTTACNHSKGSYITEDANIIIEQIDSVKYDKGLWTATLSADLSATATTATISSKFTATLSSTLINNSPILYLKKITGTVPSNGYVLIGSEVIRYGNHVLDTDDAGNPLDTGRLEQCIRGSQNTRAITHAVEASVYFTVPTTGEFLIEDEYFQYNTYDAVYGIFGSTASPLLRGRYGSIPSAHTIANGALTERRHTELESTGVFRISNEYFKYWYVLDDYFYIDKRPALISKTYYHTTGTSVTSIIEGHDVGSLITTYHFDDENSYLVDFIHTVGEHMDLAINSKIDKFENFSDVDKIDIDYLKYIVQQLGENLDDYQNLPFFTEENGDYRIRLFTKELVNIYKSKGLLSALKLWHLVISEPLKSYQDLWTFNYCSFYSLPFLVLILYDSIRNFYPNNENFLRPQISKALQEELAEFYENKKINSVYVTNSDSSLIGTTGSHAVPDLKLLVYDWEYFCKTDDDIKSSDGRNFDDKIVSSDSANDLGIFYDPIKTALQVRSNTANTIHLPFYVEDYNIDLFKFEEELDATKSVMPVSNTDCLMIKMDEGFKSDVAFEWVPYDSTENYDYCDLTDRVKYISMDSTVLHDLTSDISNAEIELDSNIISTETEIVVKVLDGKLYNPVEHIVSGTNPKIIPKGFIKIGEEVISYTGLEFYDHHEGSFVDKRFKLTGCVRGVNRTTAANYKVNLYEGNERLLADNYVEVVYNANEIICAAVTSSSTANTLTCVDSTGVIAEHGLETNDIILFTPRGQYGIPVGGIYSTWPSQAVPAYYYVYKTTVSTFQISLTPITGTVTPVTLTVAGVATCQKISFRLNLTKNPNTYNVLVGDYLQLVQSGYNYKHLITGVVDEYDYCAEEHTYGIDFETGILPIPTVKTDGAVGLPSLAPVTVYACEIDEENYQIVPKIFTDYDDFGNPIYLPHGLSNGDIVYFLTSVGNIDAYADYYISNAQTYSFEITQVIIPSTNPPTVIANNIWSCATAHGLSDGYLITFSNLGGGVVSGKKYLVSDKTTLTFKIREVITGEIVPLTLGETNIVQETSIALINIKDISNAYMVSGTRILSTEAGYQHRYSLIQHLLWRLDNEVNGNDSELVYGLSTAELATKKLDTYKGVKDGIIWPTPHFKYGFEINTDPTSIATFPPDELIELVLKKLKQYKPKNTVADLTINYPLYNSQLGITPMLENYETENLMSDAYQMFNGTTTAAPTNTINANNHDLHEGETLYIEGGTPDFIFDTLYYARNTTHNTFQVSLTPAGAILPISVVQTVSIIQVPSSEYRIELDHDITDGIVDKTYDLPIITFDVATDYGQTAMFSYIWKDGTSEEANIYYGPFTAYPQGLKFDTWRNRKRFLSYLD